MPEGFRSLTDQVVAKLRDELTKGRWTGVMPGRERLARDWKVSGKTIEAAMNFLEKEGLLERQGAGKRRRIALCEATPSSRELRVGILVGEAGILRRDFHVELRHELEKAGRSVIYAPKHMLELGMDVNRIAQMVRGVEVDAWIVNAGSREVLEWFSAQPLPVFALFGRRRGLGIAGAGPHLIPALRAVVRRMVELGHRRIVFLARKRQRVPLLSALTEAYLEELKALGIETGPYNLPDWDEDTHGLQRCLGSLFQVSPPTALILDEPALYFASTQFLMNQGIRVPRDVSLACTDHDPHFAWCKPSVAQIRWNSSLVAKRILRWTNHLIKGQPDRHLSFFKTKFIEGETIGPARRK